MAANPSKDATAMSPVETSLDYSMRPEIVRSQVEAGYVVPFPDKKVIHILKTLATTIYNQQKLTPYWHKNVCDGKNSLAYFICAMHCQSAPQPATHHRCDNHHGCKKKAQDHFRGNSGSSNGSTISHSCCGHKTPGQNCELPKLVTSSMLPLAYWDSVYYALVSEVRQLHANLQTRFRFGDQQLNEVVHQCGRDGSTEETMRAGDIANLLERVWDTAMDPRLVSALDSAIRTRKHHERTARALSGEPEPSTELAGADSDPIAAMLNVDGLIDVNKLTAETIQMLLWGKHKHEINQVCCNNFLDESMLMSRRAEMLQNKSEETVAMGTQRRDLMLDRLGTHRSHGAQSGKYDGEKSQRGMVDMVLEQERAKQEVHEQYVQPHESVANHFLGAATNSLAQLHVAALARPEPEMVQACFEIQSVNSSRDRELVSNHVRRSNTTGARLAYIPEPKTPSRKEKDPYPLDFYGARSGQRYPKMSQNATSLSCNLPAPMYNPSFYSNSRPARKPVPTLPSLCSSPSLQHPPSDFSQAYQNPTPPSSSVAKTFNEAGQITQAELISQDSCSPAGQQGTYDDRIGQLDPPHTYTNLIDDNPFTNDSPSVNLPNRVLRPDDHATSPLHQDQEISAAETLSSLRNLPNAATTKSDTHSSPLAHPPNFIAPRPALRQRYVSAGGNTRLEDRAEIPGPAFPSLTSPSGSILSKEEVDARLSDPEWVKQNFGELAFGSPGPLSPSLPRRSGDSATAAAARESVESAGRGLTRADTKRDRTSSGSSAGRMAKWVRVFSRKNSQSEA